MPPRPQFLRQVLILFSNLRELSLHVKYPIFLPISVVQPVSTGSFIQEWEYCKYLPRKINIIQGNFSAHNFYSIPSAYFRSQMPMLTSKALPTITDPDHTALPQFTICSTESSFLPVIRFRVTDSSVTLPLVEIKLLELNCGILHLTRDSYHGTQTHKAILIDKCDEYINTTDTSYSLSSVTYFDASLCPVHLEQLSDACPNLKRLELYGNSQCLNSLEGLYSLAIHCKRLHTLNLWCIDEPDCRYTCSQLWEVLCTMHLIYISIEVWMVNNVDCNMFQNYTSLKVLEVKGKFSCTTDLSLLGSFSYIVPCVF